MAGARMFLGGSVWFHSPTGTRKTGWSCAPCCIAPLSKTDSFPRPARRSRNPNFINHRGVSRNDRGNEDALLKNVFCCTPKRRKKDIVPPTCFPHTANCQIERRD